MVGPTRPSVHGVDPLGSNRGLVESHGTESQSPPLFARSYGVVQKDETSRLSKTQTKIELSQFNATE